MSNSHLPVRVLVPLPLSLSLFSLFSYLFSSRIAILLSFFRRAFIYLSIYLLPVYLPLCYLSFDPDPGSWQFEGRGGWSPQQGLEASPERKEEVCDLFLPEGLWEGQFDCCTERKWEGIYIFRTVEFEPQALLWLSRSSSGGRRWAMDEQHGAKSRQLEGNLRLHG